MRTIGAKDRKPRTCRRADPTLLDTRKCQAHWRAGQRVATLTGVRRIGTIDQPRASYAIPFAKNGHGSHVPVRWEDGTSSAEPRSNLERLVLAPGARVYVAGTQAFGFLTACHAGYRRTARSSIDEGHHMLVRLDSGRETPVPEKELKVVANAQR